MPIETCKKKNHMVLYSRCEEEQKDLCARRQGQKADQEGINHDSAAAQQHESRQGTSSSSAQREKVEDFDTN